MSFELIQASEAYKIVIKNLMQFYIYDFSEFISCDVEEDGLFEAYPYLEEYWNDENHRFPYLIKIDQIYAGFVLVRFIESEARNYFSIAEFFIMKKYRRKGIGKAVAERVFNLHRGRWEVYQKKAINLPRYFGTKSLMSIQKESLRNIQRTEGEYKILKTDQKSSMTVD